MAWTWGQKALNQHWMIEWRLEWWWSARTPGTLQASAAYWWNPSWTQSPCWSSNVTRWTNFLSPAGLISCSTEMHIQGDDCHLWGGDDQQGLREPHRHQHRGRGATLSLPLYCPGKEFYSALLSRLIAAFIIIWFQSRKPFIDIVFLNLTRWYLNSLSFILRVDHLLNAGVWQHPSR